MFFSGRSLSRRDVLQGGAIAALTVSSSSIIRLAVAREPDEVLVKRVLKSIEPIAERGSSRAVVVGHAALAHTEQVFADAGDGAACCGSLLAQLDERLALVGAKSSHAVRFNFYVADDGLVPEIEQGLAARFADDYRPTATFVTGRLAKFGARAAADCVAVVPSAASDSEILRQSGVAVLPPGGRLYISGDAKAAGTQDPAASLSSATAATLKSLENTLRFAGLDRSHVVHVKSFVTPVADADSARAAIRDFFDGRPPPMTFVEWQSKSLPIEIELIASVPTVRAGDMQARVHYLTPPGMTASPVFSRAAAVSPGPMLYTSGIYGDPSLDTPGRIRSILGEVRRLVALGGGSMTELVKATYYVSDDESSTELGKIRPEFYQPDSPPAASKAMTAAVGRPGHKIAVDLIVAADSR